MKYGSENLNDILSIIPDFNLAAYDTKEYYLSLIDNEEKQKVKVKSNQDYNNLR